MDLYKEILINVLENEKIDVFFPDMKIPIKEIIELTCYKTLCDIRDIIRNDNLCDAECFEKIEQIICKFESIGSDGGTRHDF